MRWGKGYLSVSVRSDAVPREEECSRRQLLCKKTGGGGGGGGGKCETKQNENDAQYLGCSQVCFCVFFLPMFSFTIRGGGREGGGGGGALQHVWFPVRGYSCAAAVAEPVTGKDGFYFELRHLLAPLGACKMSASHSLICLAVFFVINLLGRC